MIAFLAGIALVVLLEASGAVTEQAAYIPSIDMSGPLNSDRSYRIGYWIGYWAAHWAVMGLIPLIFAAIAIAATAYKAGLRSSLFNTLGAAGGVAGLSIMISCAQIAIAATSPMKEHPFAEASTARDGFVRGASSSCAKKLQAPPGNKSLSAADIDAYCSCYASSMADIITGDEAMSAAEHKVSASMTEKVNTVSQKCVELTLKRR
jgi:hypothetical protein